MIHHDNKCGNIIYEIWTWAYTDSQLRPCGWNTNWPLHLNNLLGQRIEESKCVQRTSINGITPSNRRRHSTRPWLKINLPFELWLVFLWTISALSKCKIEVHSQTVISAKEEVWVVVVLTAQWELLWLTSFVVTGSATAACLRVHQCSPLKDLHQDPDNTTCWWEHYLIRSLIKESFTLPFLDWTIFWPTCMHVGPPNSTC